MAVTRDKHRHDRPETASAKRRREEAAARRAAPKPSRERFAADQTWDDVPA